MEQFGQHALNFLRSLKIQITDSNYSLNAWTSARNTYKFQEKMDLIFFPFFGYKRQACCGIEPL